MGGFRGVELGDFQPLPARGASTETAAPTAPKPVRTGAVRVGQIAQERSKLFVGDRNFSIRDLEREVSNMLLMECSNAARDAMADKLEDQLRKKLRRTKARKNVLRIEDSITTVQLGRDACRTAFREQIVSVTDTAVIEEGE